MNVGEIMVVRHTDFAHIYKHIEYAPLFSSRYSTFKRKHSWVDTDCRKSKNYINIDNESSMSSLILTAFV